MSITKSIYNQRMEGARKAIKEEAQDPISFFFIKTVMCHESHLVERLQTMALLLGRDFIFFLFLFEMVQ